MATHYVFTKNYGSFSKGAIMHSDKHHVFINDPQLGQVDISQTLFYRFRKELLEKFIIKEVRDDNHQPIPA